MAWPARHISRFVSRSPADVAAFAGDPRNLPTWASGLSAGIEERDGAWVSKSPLGTVRVSFRPGRELGILDHDVTLPDGKVFHNPLRVLENDGGSEVVFTLYRLPGVDDAAYEKDAATITADLARMAKHLESGT